MSLENGVKIVAELMEVAARTAPKAVGQDFIEVKILTDDEKKKLGDEMIEMAKAKGPGYTRDGNNVLNADAVVLIGLLPHKGVGLNCGACGCDSCSEFNDHHTKMEFDGPNCSIRMLDLGIALGSAAKVASELNVDNRIMYRIGAAAKRLGFTEANISQGIPLSATGKNIFFDRS